MIWLLTNFIAIVDQLLPSFFRKTRVYILFDAMVKPLQTLADRTLYQMQHDSRVIYLEKVLNEYFNVVTYNPNSHVATRQIYIIEAARPPKNYVYKNAENQPIYLGTIYLGKKLSAAGHFIIMIPLSIPFNEDRLRDEIDFYKLAGKKYTIQTY